MPNVVVVMADSLGYGDVGAYGADDVRTPHIDSLARQGVRLTDFYANGPVCTPTRAAFITGRYQQRVGLEWFLLGQKDLGLAPSQGSLPSLLRGRGYATAMFGKWHLGDKPEFGPNAHGFDEFFGIHGWAVDYYTHVDINGEPGLFENTSLVDRPGYLTDLITERATSYIARARRPFFAFVAYNAAVAPYQAPDHPEDVRTRTTWYQGTRADVVRMIERVDDGVGRIVGALEKAGLERETLVVFTSDHGGSRLSRRDPLFHGFGTVWEGGIRVPCILRWPGRLPAGVSRHPALTMDLTASILGLSGPSPLPAPLDGIDLLPILRGAEGTAERALFWRIDNATRKQKAVRKGKWKLVLDGNGELLFNLEEDVSERRDLGFRNPGVAAELRAALASWEQELARTPPPFVVK